MLIYSDGSRPQGRETELDYTENKRSMFFYFCIHVLLGCQVTYYNACLEDKDKDKDKDEDKDIGSDLVI